MTKGTPRVEMGVFSPPVLGCWHLARRGLSMVGQLTPDHLAARLEQLVDAGVRFLSFEEYRLRLAGGLRPVGVPEALLTFDHPPAHFVELLWPALRRLGISPVLFVTTGAIGRRRRPLFPFGPSPADSLSWAELVELTRAGVSIQSHGHTGARLTDLPPEIAFGDLMRSRREVELRVGTTPTALSYPGGATDQSVTDLAAKAGFTLGFTRARKERGDAAAWGPGSAELVLPRQRVAGLRRWRAAAQGGSAQDGEWNTAGDPAEDTGDA